MRISTLAPIALAIAPAAVSAAGSLGFALGTKNADGSCKTSKDYEADFDAIGAASSAKVVRGYAASDCNYADQVYAVTVGSETLYRGNFTGPTLSSKMQAVKTALGGKFKVGTADSWNKYADGTADAVIKGNPDLLLVNAFGFWQGAPIANASHTYFDAIMQAFKHIQSVAGNSNIELWTGETGWPTESDVVFGQAVGGVTSAQTFFSQGICGMLAWGYNAFYFEAFDEPWKPKSVGDGGLVADETHWGAMNADRSTKFSLKC